MKEEIIISAGIDIGTSTTQLIFSRLTIQNTAGFGKVPQTEITSKEIFYRSKIYFTPLLNRELMDGAKIKEILKTEYEKASLTPKDIQTGAIIITGESSRKKNAEQILHALSEYAGRFVVATAGPDLESILAGKGAGAADLSKQTGEIVINLDIGGGTTNLCAFRDGEILDTACLDIGGRLIRFAPSYSKEGRTITYIAPKLKYLCEKLKLNLSEGNKFEEAELLILVRTLADYLAQSAELKPAGEMLDFMKTNKLFDKEIKPGIITFSGGVATCMQNTCPDYAYDDIGVLLAREIMNQSDFKSAHVMPATETMRATVIGAGNYSMDISGSTIEYTKTDFPIRNLPIAQIRLTKEADIVSLDASLKKALSIFAEENGITGEFAIAFRGIKCPSFSNIQDIAKAVSLFYQENIPKDNKCILIMEADIGKALGQALKRVNPDNRTIICIDNIKCNTGDYIDLGEPVAGGSVIPVVVKTLVFNNPSRSD